MCFFFFQAEDGIRDRNVTGVQTCALPIWTLSTVPFRLVPNTWSRSSSVRSSRRSEERRVGKSVDLGGRRIIKKKKKEEAKNKHGVQRRSAGAQGTRYTVEQG